MEAWANIAAAEIACQNSSSHVFLCSTECAGALDTIATTDGCCFLLYFEAESTSIVFIEDLWSECLIEMPEKCTSYTVSLDDPTMCAGGSGKSLIASEVILAGLGMITVLIATY